MTSVSKPVSEPTTTRTSGDQSAEGAKKTKDGEFDRLFDEKAGRRRDHEEGRSGGDAQSGMTKEGEDARWRAMPGDVSIAFPLRMEAAPVAQIEPVQGVDRVAEVQRIADQIVEAAEVRLGPGGTGEAHLELNVEGVGRMSVAIERTADGEIRVGFETASAQAADLLQGRADELANRLEARGVALKEITVAGADREVFRLQPAHAVSPAETTHLPERAARSPQTEGEAQQQQQRQGEGDGQRERRRPPIEIPSEDD